MVTNYQMSRWNELQRMILVRRMREALLASLKFKPYSASPCSKDTPSAEA